MNSSHLLSSLSESIERNSTVSLFLPKQFSSDALDTVIPEFFVLSLLPEGGHRGFEYSFLGG